MKLLNAALNNAVNKTIRNKDNKIVGRISEITSDEKNEAQYAILATNNFAGKEERYFAIPVSLAFMEIDDNGCLELNIKQDDLVLAKRIRFDSCPTIKENSFFPSIYEVYEYDAPQRPRPRKRAI